MTLEEFVRNLTEEYGNPSSLYRFGNQAKRAIEKARMWRRAANSGFRDHLYYVVWRGVERLRQH